MKHWFSHKWIKILAVAVSCSLMAAALALVLSGTAGPLDEVRGILSRPFACVFSAAAGKLQQGKDYIRGADALRRENNALRDRIAQLQVAARQGDLAVQENARLRRLLDLPAQDQALTLTPAWVSARSPDNWAASVTLNRGAGQDISPGQCVIDADGNLVGRVTKAGNNWCQVSLLWDGGCTLSGQGTHSGALAPLTGGLEARAQGEILFPGLTDPEQVRLGEDMVTFAGSGDCPSGLPIGVLTRIEPDPGGLTWTGHITPAASLNDLTEVFVVTAFREVG